MKITFKNVGQGDTIILEWNDRDKPKVAIIDCNKYENTIPALDFLKMNNYTEIQYLILSHPHYDHFSGFFELLNYCEKNSYSVKYFLHSCEIVPDYLKKSVKSYNAQKELIKLFDYLKQLEHRTVGEICFINAYSFGEGLNLPINNKFKIRVLAPSALEKHNYIRNTYTEDEEDPNNNANANWLSTLLKIFSDKKLVLLTSDVEKKVFQRLNSEHSEFDKRLILAQYPHHGAKKNMLKHFWNKKEHNKNSPIVFSVGKNGYGHPSNEVIEYLEKRCRFKICSTNQVGGLINNNNATSLQLDMFSIEVSKNGKNDQYNGDQVFLI